MLRQVLLLAYGLLNLVLSHLVIALNPVAGRAVSIPRRRHLLLVLVISMLLTIDRRGHRCCDKVAKVFIRLPRHKAVVETFLGMVHRGSESHFLMCADAHLRGHERGARLIFVARTHLTRHGVLLRNPVLSVQNWVKATRAVDAVVWLILKRAGERRGLGKMSLGWRLVPIGMRCCRCREDVFDGELVRGQVHRAKLLK